MRPYQVHVDISRHGEVGVAAFVAHARPFGGHERSLSAPSFVVWYAALKHHCRSVIIWKQVVIDSLMELGKRPWFAQPNTLCSSDLKVILGKPSHGLTDVPTPHCTSVSKCPSPNRLSYVRTCIFSAPKNRLSSIFSAIAVTFLTSGALVVSSCMIAETLSGQDVC